MLLPEEIYELVWQKLDAKTDNIEYSRVILPLSALLEGEFFNQYIKRGTHLLCVCLSNLIIYSVLSQFI